MSTNYRKRDTYVIYTKFFKSVASSQNCESNKLLTTDHLTKVLIRCHQITFLYISRRRIMITVEKKTLNFCVVFQKTIDLLSIFKGQIYY